jgi:hypothetical protein
MFAHHPKAPDTRERCKMEVDCPQNICSGVLLVFLQKLQKIIVKNSISSYHTILAFMIEDVTFRKKAKIKIPAYLRRNHAINAAIVSP